MPKEASKKVDQDDLGVPSTVVDVITEKVAATVSGLVGRQVAAALQEAGLSPGGGVTTLPAQSVGSELSLIHI